MLRLSEMHLRMPAFILANRPRTEMASWLSVKERLLARKDFQVTVTALRYHSMGGPREFLVEPTTVIGKSPTALLSSNENDHF